MSGPVPGIAEGVAVIAFLVIFLAMAGTYLGEAQEARDSTCATSEDDDCERARRDATIAMVVTLGVAGLGGAGAFAVSRRIATGR